MRNRANFRMMSAMLMGALLPCCGLVSEYHVSVGSGITDNGYDSAEGGSAVFDENGRAVWVEVTAVIPASGHPSYQVGEKIDQLTQELIYQMQMELDILRTLQGGGQ